MSTESQAQGRMEDMDFGRSNSSGCLTAFLVLVAFMPAPLLMGSFLLKDLRTRPEIIMKSLPYVVGLFGAYLLGFLILLFYGVFGVYRYRFTEEGIRVRGILGWWLLSWNEVNEAIVTSYRGMHLSLMAGRFRGARICLTDYRKARSLVSEIGKRLKVPIGIADHVQAMIVDR